MSLSRQATLPLCRLCVGRSPLLARSFVSTPAIYGKPRRQKPFPMPRQRDDLDGSDDRPWLKPQHHSNRGDRRKGHGQGHDRGHGKNTLSRTPSRYRVTPGGGSKRPTKLNPETLPRMLVARVGQWSEAERVAERLETFGFTTAEAQDALAAWCEKVIEELEAWDVEGEEVLPKLARLGWDAQALILAYEAGEHGAVFESAFLRHFVTYAAEHGPERLKLHLRSLLNATDLTNMAATYAPARNISRKFHLHMGPTNSGKTYNALKALSKAKTGAYAGPLRLLAHEVWERMNLGSVGDLEGKGRACNLLTGEERRIVDTEAGLVACTVEMLPLGGSAGESWDVVVIDEIQMMGDSHRGGAWTAAVMGVNAKEIHLCGDETTAALLQSMIDSFKGDTLTVHRYDRLTPLSVSDKSLDGDWNNVQPGDCVVTFSRSNVYSVKKSIEGTLGTRCAVVYGALPPETRAEQAREFNEDNGRAEVLVASDAVGMGLNLKIGRIIFESLTKFDGKKEVPLSLTQVKQIAGRAGRFGQERRDSTTDEVPTAGGSVTTLHAADLPLLRAMLPLPLPPITRATIELPTAAIAAVAPLLPATTTYDDLIDNVAALAKLPPNTVLMDITKIGPQADVVEDFRHVLTLSEVQTFTQAPVNLRDPNVKAIFGAVVRAYAEDYLVQIEEVLEESSLLRTLQTVEDTLASLPPLPPTGVSRQSSAPPVTISAIPLLESLHKALVLYIWLSYRLELAFPDRALANEYKARTEEVLEACLERLPGVRAKKRSERREEDRRKRADSDTPAKPAIEWVEREAADQSQRERKWKHLMQIEFGDRKH